MKHDTLLFVMIMLPDCLTCKKFSFFYLWNLILPTKLLRSVEQVALYTLDRFPSAHLGICPFSRSAGSKQMNLKLIWVDVRALRVYLLMRKG